MAKWSPEWLNIIKSGRCPNGHRSDAWLGGATTIEFIEGVGSKVELTWIEKFRYSDVERVGVNVTGWLARLASLPGYIPKVTVFREDSCFTCNQCRGVWPVFSDTGQVAVLGRANIRRTVEWLNTEDHLYDNRSSSIPMHETFEASRSWSQKLEVQWGASTGTSMAGKFSYSGAGIEGKVEQSLKTSLLMSAESQQRVTQAVDVMVPPRRRLTVLLHWKQVWQEGDLRIRLPDGTLAEMPYRAAVEVPTFDRENIEG